eukprot:15164264-Heterocapsa_arctica.AAC.1
MGGRARGRGGGKGGRQGLELRLPALRYGLPVSAVSTSSGSRSWAPRPHLELHHAGATPLGPPGTLDSGARAEASARGGG